MARSELGRVEFVLVSVANEREPLPIERGSMEYASVTSVECRLVQKTVRKKWQVFHSERFVSLALLFLIVTLAQ